jgi:hypothetical protein
MDRAAHRNESRELSLGLGPNLVSVYVIQM